MDFYKTAAAVMVACAIQPGPVYGQHNQEDSVSLPAKVLHAEPLYIDLIRDLGARKGEKEWNLGFGLNDRNDSDEYIALVEYEWAPINRLGLEVELPFTIYPSGGGAGHSPSSRLNSLKMAAQYSFFVSEKWGTSMAIGYIHEFEFIAFADYGKRPFLAGNVYNPFFIAAKRLGDHFHSLVYTGPAFHHDFDSGKFAASFQVNTSVHYMIPHTRNFVGVEVNKEVGGHLFETTIRPQMRVGIAENLLLGIVTGIPVDKTAERLSTFLRLIYEPGHRFGKKDSK